MNTSAHWSQVVARLEQANHPYVLVTVLAVRGSTPRTAGTKMVITADNSFGSIGGGSLEFQATESARRLLRQPRNQQIAQKLLLSTDLQQCCGGALTVLLESFVERDVRLWLFGAGHVAHALVTILAQLPVRVQWVDTRAELFPEHLPLTITKHCVEHPLQLLEQIPLHDDCLVMTHDHGLDFALIEGLLKRSVTGLVGLIGSDTKARRFRQRLKADSELEDEVIAQLQCPMGLAQIASKRPMEVAVSMAAQLLIYWQQSSALFNPVLTVEPTIESATDTV